MSKLPFLKQCSGPFVSSGMRGLAARVVVSAALVSTAFAIAGCSGSGSTGSITPPTPPPTTPPPTSSGPPAPGTSDAVSLGTAVVQDGANPVPASAAVDTAGNYSAAWVDPSGQVYVSTLAAGTSTWTTATALIPSASLSANKAIAPVSVNTDPAGNLTAVWGENQSLAASSLLIGSKQWTAPVQLSLGTDYSEPVYTAVLPNGNIEATYSEAVSINGGPLQSAIDAVAFSPQSQTWSTPTSVVTFSTALHEFNMVVTPQGAIAVLWTEDLLPNPTPNVEAARGVFAATAASSTAQFSAPDEIDTQSPADGQVSSYPNVVSDAQGNITALWENQPQAGGGTNDLYAARLTAGSSTWATPVKVDTAAGSSGVYVGYPTPTVADASGNVTAAWTTYGSSPTLVEAARFNAAQGMWSAPVVVQSLAQGESVGIPALALGPSVGEVSLFWDACAISGCVGGDIYQSIYQSGAWGSYIQADLPAPANQAATYPVAVSSGNGSAVVLWGAASSTPKAFTLYANQLK